MDKIRWAMKKRVHPEKIHSCGGFYVWDSDQEIPNLQTGTFEFADGKIMELEVRSLFTNYEEGEAGPTFKKSELELDEFDKAERFMNDDDANTYLTRQYRPPYVLPKEV